MLRHLGRTMPISYISVSGGSQLARANIGERLVKRFYWFLSRLLIVFPATVHFRDRSHKRRQGCDRGLPAADRIALQHLKRPDLPGDKRQSRTRVQSRSAYSATIGRPAELAGPPPCANCDAPYPTNVTRVSTLQRLRITDCRSNRQAGQWRAALSPIPQMLRPTLGNAAKRHH